MTKPYREIIQQGIIYSNGQSYILIEDRPVEQIDGEYPFQWPQGTARFFVTATVSDLIWNWESERKVFVNDLYRYVHVFPFHIMTNSFVCDYSTRGRKILVEEPSDQKEEKEIDNINAQFEQAEDLSDSDL